MIVVDASAALELLLRTTRGAEVSRRMAAPGESLHAPHLLDLEVAQVVRRYEAAGVVGRDDAAQAVDDLLALDIARYPHDVLLPRVWELRVNLTAYDAAYAALAEALGARILTCDARLARAPGIRAVVDVV